MAEPNFWRYLTDPAVAAPAREFARTRVRPVADHIDTADLYPVELVAETARHGWNTMTLPTRYGGGGAPMEHALAVFEELGAGSASLAVSGYNALQLKAQQRFAKGFTTLLSYTWSHSEDTSSG